MDGAHQVAISAHRGGGESAMPGTWAAYEHALSTGADYVEFDVQRTRDGHLIAYHDRRAERRGVYPRDLLHDDLSASVDGLFDVARLLRLIVGRAKAHIDLKESGYESTVVEVALGVLGDPAEFVVSGSDDVVAAVKSAYPSVRAALSLGRGWHEVPWHRSVSTRWSELRPMRRVAECGADAVAVHHVLARVGVLDQCRAAGVGTMVWTVNDPSLIRAFVGDPRVDVLITEKPGYASQVRSSFARRSPG